MTRLLRYARDHYLVVPLGALIALLWANTESESYFRFAHSLAFAANHVGMPLFFALVTQEIVETMMPGGALHSWRRGIVPVIAAFAGIAGSRLVYFWYLDYCDEVMLQQAWPVAAVVDIANSYFVSRLLFRDRGAIAFTLMLAIASDIIVLPLVAVRYPFAEEHASGAVLIALAVLLAFGLRRAGYHSPWPYLACGAVCWLGFYWSGIHPALALVPIVPFVPHARRNLELFAEEPAGPHHSHRHLETLLAYPVQIALFLFTLANAGVVFDSFEGGTWAVPIATIVGRSIAVLSAVGLAFTLLRLHPPPHFGWRELVVVTFITSTGFTFALFVATAVLPYGSLLTQTKIGALATLLGSVFAVAAAYLLRVGRFAPKAAA
jgi:NhaA family Na+:H+ antiporter